MDGKTGVWRNRSSPARDGRDELAGCAFPVGVAEKARSSFRAERLAMDGKTGVWRNLDSPARDGGHDLAGCAFPVGVAEKERSSSMSKIPEDSAAHISRQFSHELEKVRTHMLRMGGQVEKQLGDALRSVAEHDSQLAQQVIDDDALIDRLEREIDIECSLIIVRRQPAAGDLRLVLAIIKAVRDLERIGDEAARIARSALALAEEGQDPVDLGEFHRMGERVLAMVKQVLDAFARMDTDAATAIADEDTEVDNDYHGAIRSMVTHMTRNPWFITW